MSRPRAFCRPRCADRLAPPPRPPLPLPAPSASICLWAGGVPAPCGVNMTRKRAPRARGVAPPAGPSAKRTRALRVLHTGAASIVLCVRAFFQREFVTGRATKRRQVAERTAEATGLSLSVITHLTESGCGELPADGAPETRHSNRRVPPEELARVRPAIYQQYRIPMLPTLDSTLEFLNAPEDAAGGAGGAAEGGAGGPEGATADGSSAGAGSVGNVGPDRGEIGSDSGSRVSSQRRLPRQSGSRSSLPASGGSPGGGGASAGTDGGGGGGDGAGESANGGRARYVWSRATLHRAMQDIGFSFSRGPNHYDVAREKPSVRKQRNNFIDTVRKYREAGRTIYYTDETWLNKNMSTYRSWNDGSTDASLKVPSGKGARIIVAHVGSRKDGLVDGASWVFIGSKKSSDYHSEMNSTSWLQWLEVSVLPKIRDGVLVIDRAPYHLVRNEATRPAASKFRKAEFADWLQKHNLILPEWGPNWRTTCTRAVLKQRADENRPAPRYLVQDLAARFGVTILISPVAHPELNPIEMVWGTVKMSLKRANVTFSVATPRSMAEVEFVNITGEVWARYEDHSIKAETYYRAVRLCVPR